MLVYAGIDEAGYGPMLGPLCVAAVAFVLPEHDPRRGAPDLWTLLRDGVCRRRRDERKRVVVDDSKRLKGAAGTAHPLRHLERGVLGFVGALGAPCDDDAALFDRLGAAVAPEPWYGSTTPLPLAHDAGELRIAAARLRRTMAGAGAGCELIRCEAIDVEAFNRGVARMGSKSSVNFGAAMRHVDAIWRRWPGEHPRVIVDRQGGRTHYREELQLAFPEARLRIVAESEPVSRYRLERDGSALTVSFVRESEDHHLPVALASMTAKYVRELLMLRLNRFFRGHRPELEPTAGYFQDARRYLRDLGTVIDELGVSRGSLVRSV